MAGVKGRSGRPSKPTAAHKRDGTLRPDRHAGVAEAPEGAPEAPPWMTDQQREFWGYWIGEIQSVPGLLAKVDGAAVWSLCEATEDYVTAQAEVEHRGGTCVTDNGSEYQHPAVGRRNKALERLRYWLARFGLSPSDRASLKLGGGAEDPGNPFEAYLRRIGSNN